MISSDSNMLEKIIDEFNGKKILILGDLLLDEYIWGNAERISPEAPVPVVNISKRETRPGGAANVAMTIARLGGKPLLCGAIGDDEAGILFLQTLKLHELEDVIIPVIKDRITPRKTRIIASNQQMLRIDDEKIGPLDKTSVENFIPDITSELKSCDALLISDYAKGLISSDLLTPVLDTAKSKDILITVDPKPVNMNLYRGVTVLSPNLRESMASSGVNVIDRKTLRKAAKTLIEKVTPKVLLITRGGEGLSLFTSDGEEHHLPAITSHVYDVSGAGDTMIGTLTLALASSADILDATEIGNCAAGAVVRKPGVATVSTDELKEAIKNRLHWESVMNQA